MKITESQLRRVIRKLVSEQVSYGTHRPRYACKICNAPMRSEGGDDGRGMCYICGDEADEDAGMMSCEECGAPLSTETSHHFGLCDMCIQKIED